MGCAHRGAGGRRSARAREEPNDESGSSRTNLATSRKESELTRAAYLILAAYLLVLALAAATARGALTPGTVAFWDAVARCETGGNWHMRGPVYSGGVGFYNGTWAWWASELGLVSRYPSAADAPRLVQIRVADYGRRVHQGFWGCIG